VPWRPGALCLSYPCVCVVITIAMIMLSEPSEIIFMTVCTALDISVILEEQFTDYFIFIINYIFALSSIKIYCSGFAC
jgi:hypothetical protein